MATYNGAEFLSEQIDSIRAQTYSDWRLLISDDGSSDATLEIAVDYARRDERICVLESGKHFGSARDNFFFLMEQSDADRSFLADQDDVWMSCKIDLELRLMDELARETSNELPLLVFSDMVVVDEHLQVTADSFLANSGKGACTVELASLLVTNVVAGCTSCVNRALRSMIVGAPKTEAIIHDWWMALVAASCGKIAKVDEPTVLYRQHTNNAVGAETYSALERVLHFADSSEKYWASCRQATALGAAFSPHMQEGASETVRTHADEPIGSRLSTLLAMKRHRLFKKGVAKVIGQVAVVLLCARKGRA